LSKGMWRGNIVMEPGSYQLPEVVVTARYAKPAEYAGTTKYDDFFRRRKLGLGTYILRQDIERSNAFHTIEILRMVPGVKTDINGNPALGKVSFSGCGYRDTDFDATVWIDGQRVVPDRLDPDPGRRVGEMINRIGPSNIEMMEVYRGLAQIPGEFHWNGCAAIVIWTRYNPVRDTTARKNPP
ncbi:MAG TPA: Plug domain-containing protein, partial [Gemmatimonadales bacterium]|nr:Plug domain-containing protein [Gemmatimonadales bacterium]